MNNYSSSKILYPILITTTFFGGCSTIPDTATLSGASDTFDKTVQSANSALSTELKSKPRTRRFEAIEYYLATRQFVGQADVAVIADITPNDEVGSFSRFACAGAGSLVRAKNGLEYAAAYSAGLKDILAPGDATLSGQFAVFSSLNKPITVSPVPDTPKPDAVRDCAANLNSLFASWKPAPTTDIYDESPVLLSAAIASWQALKTFMITGLSVYNKYEQKQKFTEYVNKWDENFKKVMSDSLTDGALENAWSHRIVVSTQRPLITFRQIFHPPSGITPENDKERIRLLGMLVNKQLAEFDALQGVSKPIDVKKALLEAQEKMMKLANDKNVTIDQLITFLSALVKDFKDIQSKYHDANEAAKTLYETLPK